MRDIVVGVPVVQRKQYGEPFPKHGNRCATVPLFVVHLDLYGPMPVVSLGGSTYFLFLIDNFSGFSWIYFLSHKDQAFDRFQAWHTMVERESGHSMKMIRSNKGGELVSHEFDHHLEAHSIRHKLANTCTPSKNGVVECKTLPQ